MPKSAVGPMNSNKNKLNSEIIFIFHLNPNAPLIYMDDLLNHHVMDWTKFLQFGLEKFFI